MPPEPTGVGKAVQQDDRAPRPRDLVLDTNSVDIHPAHLAPVRSALVRHVSLPKQMAAAAPILGQLGLRAQAVQPIPSAWAWCGSAESRSRMRFRVGGPAQDWPHVTRPARAVDYVV